MSHFSSLSTTASSKVRIQAFAKTLPLGVVMVVPLSAYFFSAAMGAQFGVNGGAGSSVRWGVLAWVPGADSDKEDGNQGIGERANEGDGKSEVAIFLNWLCGVMFDLCWTTVRGCGRDVKSKQPNRPQYYIVGACFTTNTKRSCVWWFSYFGDHPGIKFREFGARIWCFSNRVGQNMTFGDIT